MHRAELKSGSWGVYWLIKHESICAEFKRFFGIPFNSLGSVSQNGPS